MTTTEQGGPVATGPMSNWRLAAFAAPCIPVAAMLMPVTVYLPNYYATELGVSLAVLASVFAVIRLFDLWLDPILGLLIDRTNSRWGRYRPWLVGGLPIALVAAWMLFMAKPGIDGTYILAWLVMGFLGQSMASMAHVAWAARIAPQYDQRSRVYGWWQGFTVAGMITVLAMPPLMKIGFGLDHTAGVKAMGWFVIATLPPTILLAVMAVREPAVRPNAHPPHWRQYLALLRRGTVLRLLATDIALGTGPAIAGSLFFFYFEAIRGVDRSLGGLLLLLYFVGALAGAPLWTRLARRIGKHKALMIAALGYAAAQASIMIAPLGLAWGIVTMVLAGLPFSAGPILLRAMMADVGDEERLASGVDRNGLLFGLLSGTVKIGSALAVFVGFQALSVAGFEAKLGAANSDQALLALSLAFSVLPALLGLVSAALIAGHRLDATAHAVIRRDLDARDGFVVAAAASDEAGDGSPAAPPSRSR
ncbi:MAG: MFS transporter [Caulobacter sp.]|nr:MFS transporter [Caulobacter sp.]